MSAADRTRPVFGAPLLLGFAFMMGVVSTVVFPTAREFAEAPAKQPVDAYSIAYLRVLTRANPRDAQLRAVYVRQLAALGRWDEALAALGAAPADPKAALSMRTLRLDLLLARARAMSEGSASRAAALEGVHHEVRAMLGDARGIGRDRVRDLVGLSLELEDPSLAARYCVELAELETEPLSRAEALGEAGKWFRASGDGARAAELQRRAAETSPDPARKSRHMMAAADTLEAMERPCEAAALLAHDAGVSSDRAFVQRATALMTSCGRARDAKILGRHLVAVAPDDKAERRAQVRRELAAGDPAGALALLGPLVKSHPNDLELRETTARVAEWAGHPYIALEHWVWLISRGKHSRSPQPEL
ncbi:MAG: hypothetical protein KF819_34490 [Labilithrix sp.]|nr:hypothetical protein [Labilithrix sp.]